LRVAKTILLVLSGGIAGIAFGISCGDNWQVATDAAIDAPMVADAAPVCDCPAAEPPLAGRFVLFSGLTVIPGNDYAGQGAGCPAGTKLISGSCTTDLSNPLRDVTMLLSGFVDDPPTAWLCRFRNNEDTPVTIRVSVVCLKPAP
jgi:hypothetical protein